MGGSGACQRPIKCWDAIFMQDPTNLPAPFLTSHVMFLPGLIISLYPDRNDFFKDPSTLQGLWKCDIPAKSHDSPSLSKWCFRKITLPPGVFCVWYLGVVLLLFAGDIELTKYEPCHLVLVVCGVSRASRSQGPIVALLWSDTFSITLVTTLLGFTTSSHFKMNSCHQFVRRTHMAALFFWFR